MKARSPKLLIFLTVFVDLLGFGIVIPILSPISSTYVHGENKWFWVGLLMSSYSILQMIFAPIWGKLSDRHGRRPILLLSLAGSTTSYAIFGLAPTYGFLLLGRMIAGLCGANLTAAQAYMADVTKPEERAAGMGMIGMAFGLGFTFGPVLGGIAAYIGGSTKFLSGMPAQFLPATLAATICGVNFLWALRSLPESLPVERRSQVDPTSSKRFATFHEVAAALAHPIIGPLALVFFLSTLAFANMETGLGPYIINTPGLAPPIEKVEGAKSLPADEAVAPPDKTEGAKPSGERMPGMNKRMRKVYGIFIYVGLLLAFMQGYVVRKLVKFVPATVLVVVGTAAQAVALAIFPLFPTMWCVLLAMGILAFGQGVCVPSLLSVVSLAAGARRQGETLGVTQSSSTLGRIIGPMTMAAAIWVGTQVETLPHTDATGLRWPFWMGAIGMVAAMGMAIVTRRRILARPLEENETAAA